MRRMRDFDQPPSSEAEDDPATPGQGQDEGGFVEAFTRQVLQVTAQIERVDLACLSSDDLELLQSQLDSASLRISGFLDPKSATKRPGTRAKQRRPGARSVAVSQIAGSAKTKGNDATSKSERRNRITVGEAKRLLSKKQSPTHQQLAWPPKVLLIDDERVARTVLARTLRLIGIDSSAVPDGHSALDMLKNQQFDVIFIDLEMPNMDGFEVARRVRELPNGAQSNLVAVSTGEAYDMSVRAENEGIHHYLAKPLTKLKLEGVFAPWLSGRMSQSTS